MKKSTLDGFAVTTAEGSSQRKQNLNKGLIFTFTQSYFSLFKTSCPIQLVVNLIIWSVEMRTYCFPDDEGSSCLLHVGWVQSYGWLDLCRTASSWQETLAWQENMAAICNYVPLSGWRNREQEHLCVLITHMEENIAAALLRLFLSFI